MVLAAISTLAHGAGVRLKRTATETAISEAVERVLGDPSFRPAVARIVGTIRAGSGPTVAVEAIEAAAASRTPLMTVATDPSPDRRPGDRRRATPAQTMARAMSRE